MAALEYLTQNSLTAYPFKAGREIDYVSDNHIKNDWFYDILFVSYTPSIRSVYINHIAKDSSGNLELSFSNTETESQIGESFTIASSDVVNHFGNTAKSFAAYSCEFFSVKFIFGAGLVFKPAFTQEYGKQETALASAAITLAPPQVKTVTIESYNSTVVGNSTTNTIEQIAVFTKDTDIPTIQPRHNSEFIGIASDAGELYVEPGLGAGLYDGCVQPNQIHDVYTINSVVPDAKGSLWINPSACYSLNTLSAQAAIEFGNYDLDGALYPYHSFLTNREDVPVFDAVSIGHSLYLENFCKPKCPPENLAAFAYYLNRVTDGAQELDDIASSNTETRGQGLANLKVFTASAFCVSGDTAFERCTDPSNPDAYIACNDKFIKYFHEGRALQIFYTDSSLRKNFTIVEVLTEDSVLLDDAPTIPAGTESLSFRVIDNGVVSNINCASSMYNLEAGTFMQPYFKVKYTTTEAFDTAGVYSTYVTVTVALFNPAAASKQLLVTFDANEKYVQQGNYKIRTEEGVQISQQGSVQLNCRKYAFIEAAYAMACETYGGELDISVYLVDAQNLTQVGQTFNLPTIDGTACPGTTAGAAYSSRFLQSSLLTDINTLTLPTTMTDVVYYRSKTGPFWLTFDFTPDEDKVYLSYDITKTAPTTSARYYTTFKTYGGTVPGVISRLTIDYMANPVVISPLESTYNIFSPLSIGKDVQYTADNPVFQVVASNMTILSTDYPEDLVNFRYSLEGLGLGGVLPDGLVFDATTGKLTGTLASSYDDGDTFEFRVTAYNTSGQANNPQIISVVVATDKIPQVSIDLPPTDNIFEVDNLISYTSESPLLSLTATNLPINQYTLIGTLPQGLVFDASAGKIVGRIKEALNGTKNLSVFTRNVFGPSNTIYFSISYSVYDAPVITSPDNLAEFGFRYDLETTENEPLAEITALQAYGGTDNYAAELTDQTRNKYTSVGLPLGLTLSLYTGKIYGLLDESIAEAFTDGRAQVKTYPVRIIVSNPVGSSAVTLLLSPYVPGKPYITTTSGESTILTRGFEYTSARPVNAVFATNNPTGFNASGLPTGLTCTSTGKIIGTVINLVDAGVYSATISAYNAEGTSDDYTHDYIVPITVTYPAQNETVSVEVGQPITITFTYTPLLISETLDVSVSTLPSGLTYDNGVISGAPLEVGGYQIYITIVSSLLGTTISSFSLAVLSAKYSLSGTLTLTAPPQGFDASNVSMSLGNTTTTVAANGNFTFEDLAPGIYTVKPVSDTYHLAFSPTNRSILITSSDISGVNFTGDGPYRQISGTITGAGGAIVTGLVITVGEKSVTCDSAGVFSLLVPITDSLTVTPSGPHHTFSPSSRTYSSLDTFADIDLADFTAYSSITPSAPQVKTITASDQQISVYFMAPANAANASITNYEYSVDAGNYIPLSPANPNATSLAITDLTNGTAYTITLRAVSGSIKGYTASFISTPVAGGTAPVLDPPVAPVVAVDGITAGDQSLSVAFTTTDTEVAQITNHEYTLDGGVTWIALLPETTTSPLTIRFADNLATRLTNGTTYSLKIRALNTNGVSGAASSPARSGTPVALPSAPIPATSNTVVLGDGTATFNFVPPATDGGSAILYYEYSVNSVLSNDFIQITPASPNTSSVTLTGLTNGTTYALRVRAVNATGAGTITGPINITPRTVPSAPTIASGGIVAGDKKLTVTFTPPANNGGAAITAYEYFMSGNSARVRAAVNNNSFQIIKTDTGSQLTNGTTYSIGLAAINSAGAGELSSPLRTGIPTAGANPPTINTVTSGDTKLTLEIAPPTNTGGEAISSYVYKVGSNADAWRTVIPVSEVSGVITFDIATTIAGEPLVNGTTYVVYVASVNSLGPGLPTVKQGKPVGPAGEPTITIIRPTTRQLSVEFTAPTSNGGSAIVGYKYRLNENSSWVNRTPLNSIASPIVITGLTDGTEYTISIRAVTAYGDGLITTYPTVMKPGLLPAAPVITSVDSGDATLTVYLNAPTNNGSPAVIDYQYNVGNGWLSRDDSPSANRPVVITKKAAGVSLVNGETYNIKLRAVNITGVGPDSNILAATAGTPQTPSISSVGSSQESLIINFLPTVGISGGPVQGYEYSVSTTAVDTWVASTNEVTQPSPITVSGLTNGTSYRVRIRAYNSFGYSAGSVAVIALPGLPSAPVITSAETTDTGEGKSSVSLYFTLPSDGGSPVTNYEVSNNGGTTFRALSPKVSSSPLTVTGASNGTIYNYVIRAVTSLGKSPASNTFQVLPGGTVAPRISALVIEDNTHKITFTPPISIGKTIVGYEAGLRISDELLTGTTATPRTHTVLPLSSGTSSPLYLSGRTADQAYTKLHIRAIFDDSTTSPWSLEDLTLPTTDPRYPLVLQSYVSSDFAGADACGNALSEHNTISIFVDFILPEVYADYTITSVAGVLDGELATLSFNSGVDWAKSPHTRHQLNLAVPEPDSRGLYTLLLGGYIQIGGGAIVAVDESASYFMLATSDYTYPQGQTNLTFDGKYTIEFNVTLQKGDETVITKVSPYTTNVLEKQTKSEPPKAVVVSPQDGGIAVTYTPNILYYAGGYNYCNLNFTGVEYSVNGGASYTIAKTYNAYEAAAIVNAQQSFQIYGLSNNTTYSVKLRQLGGVGKYSYQAGLPYALTASVTPMHIPGTPATPANVKSMFARVAQAGNIYGGIDVLMITFDPTDDAGSPITLTEVGISNRKTWLDTQSLELLGADSNNIYAWAGRLPGYAQGVSVRLTNANGAGGASDIASPTIFLEQATNIPGIFDMWNGVHDSELYVTAGVFVYITTDTVSGSYTAEMSALIIPTAMSITKVQYIMRASTDAAVVLNSWNDCVSFTLVNLSTDLGPRTGVRIAINNLTQGSSYTLQLRLVGTAGGSPVYGFPSRKFQPIDI